jgi:hypothetical protein
MVNLTATNLHDRLAVLSTTDVHHALSQKSERCVDGLDIVEIEKLREAILSAITTEEAIPTERDEYSQRYVVDFSMKRQDKGAVVRSSWIVRSGEDHPRLTSCYVL